MICSGLGFLGVRLDEACNRGLAGEGVISPPDSRVKVVALPTDEEFIVARDAFGLLEPAS